MMLVEHSAGVSRRADNTQATGQPEYIDTDERRGYSASKIFEIGCFISIPSKQRELLSAVFDAPQLGEGVV